MTVRLAVIPGDGVGPEVVSACVPVLAGALEKQGESLELTELDWGADRFLREGAAMPADGADTIRAHDAALFGAVGRPDVPDHELVWGLIIGLRQQLDLAVNIRPVRAFPGVPSRVKDVEGVDLVIVRENTEGEYVGAGGLAHAGTGHDLGIEVAVHSRRVIERAAEHAFSLAEQRNGPPRPRDEVQRDALRLPAVGRGRARGRPSGNRGRARDRPRRRMAARMIQRPRPSTSCSPSNLFGDILSATSPPCSRAAWAWRPAPTSSGRRRAGDLRAGPRLRARHRREGRRESGGMHPVGRDAARRPRTHRAAATTIRERWRTTLATPATTPLTSAATRARRSSSRLLHAMESHGG